MNNSKHQLEITDLDCSFELTEEEMANIVGGGIREFFGVILPINNPFDTYDDLKAILNGEDPEKVARQRGATLIDRAENVVSTIVGWF